MEMESTMQMYVIVKHERDIVTPDKLDLYDFYQNNSKHLTD